MCKVGGCSTQMGFNKNTDWASFAKYFGVTGLARKHYKSTFNMSCPDYDTVKAKIFPEIYKD